MTLGISPLMTYIKPFKERNLFIFHLSFNIMVDYLLSMSNDVQ